MKKILTLSIFMLVLVGFMFAQTPGRITQIQLALEEGDIMDLVTNTGNTHSEHYHLRVLHVETGEMVGTDLGLPANYCRIVKTGSQSAGFFVRAIFNQSAFEAVWPAGSHLRIMVWYTGETDNPTGEEPYAHLEYAEATYEVTPGGGVMSFLDPPFIIPPFAGGEPELFTISGAFTTEHWDFEDIVINIDPAIEGEIEFDAITGLYSFEVPEGWSGMVFPTKAGYIITPENREYNDVDADFENQDYAITKEVDPNVPVITFPENGQVFEWEEPQSITFEWEAPEGFAPEYYEIKFGEEAEWENVGDVLTWESDILGEGGYVFMLRGVINTALGKVSTPLKASLSSAYSNANLKGAGDYAMVAFEVQIEEPGPEIFEIVGFFTGDDIDFEAIDFNIEPYDDEIDFVILEDGFYNIYVPAGWTGTVTPVLEGYVFEPAFREYAEVDEDIEDEDYAVSLIVPDVPADATEPVDVPGMGGDVGISSDTDLYFEDDDDLINTIINLLPNMSGDPDDIVAFAVSGTGIANVTITIDLPGTWYGVIVVGGQQTTGTPYPLVVPDDGNEITFTGVNFDAKGNGGIVLQKNSDPTLPVELSAFNAVLTAQNYVMLNWTSESETNMLGYRVYRAESAELEAAILITPIMIQATNTSTTQHYSLEDKEVYTGTTYYYWLEAVDYTHSTMHGYSAVEVLADVAPELPMQSVMKNAYPNPFKNTASTNIEVSVKAGETANITVYNVLGQVVKTYKVNEGNHKLTWNGRDSKGNLCGSGIYFYKMSTPTVNQTKKMVIVK